MPKGRPTRVGRRAIAALHLHECGVRIGDLQRFDDPPPRDEVGATGIIPIVTTPGQDEYAITFAGEVKHPCGEQPPDALDDLPFGTSRLP
jgi:hypothetical protein